MADAQQVELWRVREPERPLREAIPQDGIEQLAESIKRHGLLNPITVRDRGGFYEVIAGHRRLLACRRLALKTVPVLVVAVAEGDAAIVGAHENLVRTDMSVREEARLVAALMAREGWGIAAAARALNRGEGWIRDRIDFLQWPPELVDGVTQGRIAMGAGKALMAIRDERARGRLVGYALASGVSVEVARRWDPEVRLSIIWAWLAEESAPLTEELLQELVPSADPRERQQAAEALSVLQEFFRQAYTRYSPALQIRQPWAGFVNSFRNTEGVTLENIAPAVLEGEGRTTVEALLTLTGREGEESRSRRFRVSIALQEQEGRWLLDDLDAEEQPPTD